AAVLSEIASRALSPAINDPGTAIDVISRAIRVLSVWDLQDSKIKVVYPRLFVTPIRLEDLFDDLFVPIARDGASIIEVGLRLQKAFLTLSKFGDVEFKKIAMLHATSALKRAEATAMIDEDLARLRHTAELLSKNLS
ncbi:DUF2254 family protein, partial [Agrobacterium salinitolerans]